MAIFVHENEFWSTGFPKTWSAEWKQKDSRYDAKGSLTMLDLLGANSIVYDNDLSKKLGNYPICSTNAIRSLLYTAQMVLGTGTLVWVGVLGEDL